MRLRQAKKIVKDIKSRRNSGWIRPTARETAAVYRYLQWPYRFARRGYNPVMNELLPAVLGFYVIGRDGRPVHFTGPRDDYYLLQQIQTIVRRTESPSDDRHVSTIFLALDHNHGRFFGSQDQRPLLFETMYFEDGSGSYQRRDATLHEALVTHYEIAAEVGLL